MFNINSITFDQIPDYIQRVGEKIAVYQSQYEHLDDMTKVTLAKLASKYEGSEATRQRLAYADALFEWHLEGRQIARNEMLKNKAYMAALESKFEYMRSSNANKRAEMRM